MVLHALGTGEEPAGQEPRRGLTSDGAGPQSLEHRGGPEGKQAVEGRASHSGSRLFVMASQRFFRRAWATAQPRTIRWYATESSSKTAASHSAQSS